MVSKDTGTLHTLKKNFKYFAPKRQSSNNFLKKSVSFKETKAQKKLALRMESRKEKQVGKHTGKLFLAHICIHCSIKKALNTNVLSMDDLQGHLLHSPSQLW